MKFEVNKLEVAKRELETAIDLFFQNADPVSIHSLTSASYEIFEVLAKEREINSVLHEGLKSLHPDKAKEIRKKLHIPQNFFKHSGKNIDEKLEFNDKVTEFYIYDSCRLYRELLGKDVKKFLLYKLWFALEHPDLFDMTKIIPLGSDLSGVTSDRALFYQLASEAFDSNPEMAKLL